MILGSMPRPLSATSKIAKPSFVRPDGDVAGNAGLEILSACRSGSRDLLQREAIADNVRPSLDADLSLRLRGLMRPRS